MPREQEALLASMIELLAEEQGEEIELPEKEADLLVLWRGLVNERPVGPLPPIYQEAEDQFLTSYRLAHQVGMEACLTTEHDQLFLYEGDLCHLQVDAVVNAANSRLLGCFIPNHACLDNALHTFAGVGLRQYCAKLMEGSAGPEPVGRVQVSPGFQLPARYVFHTVGPFIAKGRPVSPIRRDLLRQCYVACLQEAEARGLSTIAFPALSTGEFGYPKDEAAGLAVETVEQWLKETRSSLQVIFSTFSAADKAYYGQLLGRKERDDCVADT